MVVGVKGVHSDLPTGRRAPRPSHMGERGGGGIQGGQRGALSLYTGKWVRVKRDALRPTLREVGGGQRGALRPSHMGVMGRGVGSKRFKGKGGSGGRMTPPPPFFLGGGQILYISCVRF